MSHAPLDGVLVVSLEQAVAAPFATRQLADLGARVLKVERPGSGDFAREYDTTVDGSSAYFVWANRGKDSVVLDLKDEHDRSLFDRLIAGADVFVQNLSPAAANRSSIQAEQLRARHPHLIACDISGYGLGGPRTDDKAYDLAIQAEGGAIALTGPAEQACKVGFSVADISAGMYALTSILAALHRRGVTGAGASIEISMLECVAEWTAAQTYAAIGTGSIPARSGHRHSMIAPYGIYELADGASILIGLQSNPEWKQFAEIVLEQPDLASDPSFATNADRIANIDRLEEHIEAVFSTTEPGDVVDRLDAARITHSRVRDAHSLWHHEQLRDRDRFMTVTTPTGTAEVYRPPFNIDGLPNPRPSIPALGEHDPELVGMLLDRAGEPAGPERQA